MTAPFSDDQLFDWLRLIRSENVGPRTFRALVNQFGGARAALEALPDLARKSGRARLRIASEAEIEREMRAARAVGARFLASAGPGYPKALRAVDTAPPVICVRGDVAALAAPCVAIVGSRNASAAGLTFAGRLARELADAGFGVVSGLARGVDTAAHRAAPGATIAVLAGGLGRVYPAENEPLHARILDEGGAVLSEMPFSWEPKARDFPRRNRIVSGLSLGTVVVEAARRSGSLITARFANEQGRIVFAVPGSPLDPRAEGANALIREGATLCAAADHVVSALMPLVDASWIDSLEAQEVSGEITAEALWDELDWLDFGVPLPPPPRAPLVGIDLEEPPSQAPAAGGDAAEPEARVLALLGPAPVGIDDLARQSGLPIGSVNRVLTELELSGRLERHGGNGVSLTP
ncbi:DNA-processing protein DprA [Salinarimonas chemoclinalis]|uniref:DNA-processing protein DprA n=1 Tax=Salinarimonas chemoclinalis TaxID=3241599 RepID=UPI003558B5C7